MDLLEHLALEIEKTGHSVKREATSFLVEPINLTIECTIGERKEHHANGQYSVVFPVSVKATHEQLFPGGIWDSLGGFGDSDDEAFAYAAEWWTSGIFLPIHEILVPTETPEFGVERLNMISRNEESGEQFPWKVYLGALQAIGDFTGRQFKLEIDLLLRTMFNAISSELYEKKLFWIKAYISKLPDGKLFADCWLNNQDWIIGLDTLHWFAEEWGETDTLTSLKQFMIIKPCDWAEIENVEKLRQSLPPVRN